jgi:hypothetical protein
MSTPASVYKTRSGTDANAPALDGQAVTSTNTYYSDTWTGSDSDGYSLSVFYTGTPTGTFTLWFTDKPLADPTTDNDWIQETTFAPTNPAGAAGKFGDPAGNFKSYRKRLKYVNASGSGTVFAYVTVPHFRG